MVGKKSLLQNNGSEKNQKARGRWGDKKREKRSESEKEGDLAAVETAFKGILM